MNKEERIDYIFGVHPNQPIKNRFEWLNGALLNDIQTFIDGVDIFLDGTHHGGGNLSIPILICTGLEFVSSLYVGKTKYMEHNGYNATENVERFIHHFFHNNAKRVPRLLWDGIRNGINHLFIPKSMQYSDIPIKFTFYVQDASVPSCVIKYPENILIKINSIQFYGIFKRAIDDYKTELKNDENLQCHFINAWQSIEDYVHNVTNNQKVSTEVEHLLNELNESNTLSLF